MTRDLICSRQFTTLEYFPVFTLIRVKWHPGPPGAAAVRHTIASTFFPRLWRRSLSLSLFLSFSLSSRENPVVHVGEKRYESGIRVKNASISRLLYFTRRCIRRIRLCNARKKPPFQRHERKELCVSRNYFCKRKLNFDRSKRIISISVKLCRPAIRVFQIDVYLRVYWGIKDPNL